MNFTLMGHYAARNGRNFHYPLSNSSGNEIPLPTV